MTLPMHVNGSATVPAERVLRHLGMPPEEIRAVEAQKKRPTALVAMAVGLLVVIGGLGIFLYNQRQETAEKEAAMKAKEQQIRDDIDKTLAKLADEMEFEALVPVGRWRWFGGVTNFNGAGFECFSWAAGMAASTTYPAIFATAAALR